MGFEDDDDDFWRGDGSSHSKQNMLRVLVERGGVLTGTEDGDDVFYAGAFQHAQELASEGFAMRSPVQPIEGAVLWLAVGKDVE